MIKVAHFHFKFIHTNDTDALGKCAINLTIVIVSNNSAYTNNYPDIRQKSQLVGQNNLNISTYIVST